MIRYFRTLVFWVFLFSSVIFLGTILPLLAIFSKDKKSLYQKSVRFFLKLLFILVGLRVKVIGQENIDLIDPEKGLILAANHSSFIDSFVLLAKLPFTAISTVYSAGFRLPFLKTLYKGTGSIGVGAKGIKETTHLFSLFKAIKNKERIIIFSKISKDEQSIEFNRNIVEISNKLAAPVLPVSISGTSKVLPLKGILLGSRNITLSLGKPAYFSTSRELTSKIHNMHARIS